MGSVMLLLLGLAVLLCVWFFGARYPSFDGAKREEGPIPLEDGFCPQGICPLPEASGYDYAVSGYLKGGPSRVYLVGETAKYVTLKKGGRGAHHPLRRSDLYGEFSRRREREGARPRLAFGCSQRGRRGGGARQGQLLDGAQQRLLLLL